MITSFESFLVALKSLNGDFHYTSLTILWSENEPGNIGRSMKSPMMNQMSNGTKKWASGFFRANKTREQERAFDENNVITVILTLLTLEFFYWSFSPGHLGHFDTKIVRIRPYYCKSL